MHSKYRGMAFLLSLGSLPIGCNKDDNETTGLGTLGPITTQSDNSGGTVATGETGGTTTTGDDPTSFDTTTDDGSASATVTATNPTSATNMTTSPASGPQTGDPATSDPVTGDPDGSASEPQMTTFVTGNTDDTGFPETGGGESPYCQAYGDKIAECFGRDPGMVAADCQYYIYQGLQMDGPGCAQAFESMFACLSQLDCASFEMGTGCDQEVDALPQACPSMGGP
jgi:hypothetical protein